MSVTPMTEQPAARPVRRLDDSTAADAETLIDMGVLDEQPTPPAEE